MYCHGASEFEHSRLTQFNFKALLNKAKSVLAFIFLFTRNLSKWERHNLVWTVFGASLSLGAYRHGHYPNYYCSLLFL